MAVPRSQIARRRGVLSDTLNVSNRPNIVLFMADQLRADALEPFAQARKTAYTPVLDQLAARSTVFTDAHVQHPVCGPSRVSMMTGWYPHVHGHRTLTNLLQPGEPNMLRLARDVGYNVCFAGRRGDVFAPGVTEDSTDDSGWLVKPRHWFSPSPFVAGSPEWSAMLVGRRDHDVADGPVLDFDEACIRTAEQWLADAPRALVVVRAITLPSPTVRSGRPMVLDVRGRRPSRSNCAASRKARVSSSCAKCKTFCRFE
jgi:arylsulfatase A-like enzyme